MALDNEGQNFYPARPPRQPRRPRLGVHYAYPIHLQPPQPNGRGFVSKSMRPLHDRRARRAIMRQRTVWAVPRDPSTTKSGQLKWMGQAQIYLDPRTNRRRGRWVMNVKFGAKTRPC